MAFKEGYHYPYFLENYLRLTEVPNMHVCLQISCIWH